MTAEKLALWIIYGVLFALIGYLWLVVIMVQGPEK